MMNSGLSHRTGKGGFMKHATRFALCLALFAWILPGSLEPCTTFVLKDGKGRLFFGRNFDFPAGPGHIHVNLRGAAKTSLPTPGEKPLTWVAKYGSVSFNQNGREFPYGGINEAGLVIEQMMHESPKSRYPQKDGRFGLEELQWIQYQLDTAATVADVAASDGRVRVSDNSVAPLHFLVADAKGDTAVIEYLAGKMTCYRGADLPLAACANSPYEDSLAYYRSLDGGGLAQISNADGRISSENRFARAAWLAGSYATDNGEPVAYALDILQKVASRGTQWSIVYDLEKLAIHFRTTANPRVRVLSVKDFDFACGARWLLGDIHTTASKADFLEYTAAANAAMINAVWDNVGFLKALPGEQRRAFANYPESVRCPEKKN